MKIKSILPAFAIMMTLIFTLPLDMLAQGKGKGGPPPWAPAHGYRAKTSHVYFPDHNFYFDVQKDQYIYLSGANWEVSVKLPSLYAGIDLKLSTKVELELGSESPQKHNAEHRVQYKTREKVDRQNQRVAREKERVKRSKTKLYKIW